MCSRLRLSLQSTLIFSKLIKYNKFYKKEKLVMVTNNKNERVKYHEHICAVLDCFGGI